MSLLPGEGWVIAGEDNYQVVGPNEQLNFSEDFEQHIVHGDLRGGGLFDYPVERLSSQTMACTLTILSYLSGSFEEIPFSSNFRLSFFLVIEDGRLPEDIDMSIGFFEPYSLGSAMVHMGLDDEGISLSFGTTTTFSPWSNAGTLLNPSDLSFVTFYLSGSEENGIQARVRTSYQRTTGGETEIVQTSDHQLAVETPAIFQDSTFSQLIISGHSAGNRVSLDNISVISSVEGGTDYNNPLLNRNDFNGDGYA
ncbi:hypothetical protein, partial [Pararhodospirillum oryzae]|uniref:hypothetical protein n=1 Tax=Pararhodospirillum oryzae TaxID=478448 RepID=UPI0011BE3316